MALDDVPRELVAAQRDLWRPTEVLAAFQQVGFNPSLSKVAAMWGGTPISVRLDDLDKICAALDCTVGDLLQAEPVDGTAAAPPDQRSVAGAERASSGPVRPSARGGRKSGSRAAAELKRTERGLGGAEGPAVSAVPGLGPARPASAMLSSV